MCSIITHETGVYWYRRRDRWFGMTDLEQRLVAAPENTGELRHAGSASSKSQIKSLFKLDHHQTEVHLLLDSVEARPHVRSARSHVWRSSLPQRAFVRADDSRMLVPTPEFLFALLARGRSVESLALFGCELCGSYVPDASAPRGFTTAEPVTTPELIMRALEEIGPSPSSAKAMRAASFVVAGSASPTESMCAVCLQLPLVQGGAGLVRPLMNQRVDITPEEQAALGSSFLRTDISWPGSMVAIEYDSDGDHSDSEKLRRTSARRDILEAHGFRVVSITSHDLGTGAAFALKACQVRRALGHKEIVYTTGRQSRMSDTLNEMWGHRI